ncbi:MAG: hypothetical protein ACT4ON_05865 [Bacteroidota bacterium]
MIASLQTLHFPSNRSSYSELIVLVSHLAFLLPLTTLESAKRQFLFRCGGLELILFDHRINFETPDGDGNGSWFATAWFTNGLKVGKELTFFRANEKGNRPCRFLCNKS